MGLSYMHPPHESNGGNYVFYMAGMIVQGGWKLGIRMWSLSTWKKH